MTALHPDGGPPRAEAAGERQPANDGDAPGGGVRRGESRLAQPATPWTRGNPMEGGAVRAMR
jgi:hypothetical protein